MRFRGFWFCFTIFFLLFLGDIISTILVGDLVVLLESNPIFISSWGIFGLLPIVLVNILTLLIFIVAAYKIGIYGRYVIMICMLSICYARIIAIRNAISWYNIEVTPQIIERISSPEVQQTLLPQYMSLITTVYLIMIIGIITFTLWTIDHKSKVRDGG